MFFIVDSALYSLSYLIKDVQLLVVHVYLIIFFLPSVVIEEIIEDEKPSNGNANRRRLKKKHQLSDSDDGGDGSKGQLVVKGNNSAVLESEDEDGFPISFSSRRKNVVKDSEGNSNLNFDKTVDEDGKKTNANSQDERSTRCVLEYRLFNMLIFI